MHSTIRQLHALSTGARLAAFIAAGTLAITACGGGSDADPPPGAADDTPALDESGIDDLDESGVDDLDTSGLDEGQQEVLDDVGEGLDEEFSDESDELAQAWTGIRLVSSRGDVRLETLDAEQFSGVVENYSVSFPDALDNPDGIQTIDNSVIVDDTMWLSTPTTLHRIELADGSSTTTISIDDVLPGGEFGDITGDANGVYVLAVVVGGGDVIAEIDPSAGTVRSTIDVSEEAISLNTIASNATHVAAGWKDAPGIPVKLIDRATGAITDVGNYLQQHAVQIVRDELWVIVDSGSTSEPNTYEKYNLDGSPIGGGTLPGTGSVKVFGDRIVHIEEANSADPADPVAPVEVEPQGAPIEDFLPAGTVLLTAYAEIDGLAVSSGNCCLQDESDFPLNTAVVDMATGEVVHTADSIDATAILPVQV